MLLLFGAFVSVLLLWVYLKWSRVRRYWADRGVPHDPPHPLLGSLNFMLKVNPAIWVREIYDKYYKAPYVGIWLFWRPALVINSPEIGRRILIKDFDCFRNRLAGTGCEKADPIGGQNIFMLNDPTWSSIRRRLTPVFTSSKLKSLHNLYSTKAKEVVRRINNDLKQNKKIELRNLYADYTTDIIGTSSFGIQLDTTLTAESTLRNVTKDFMEFSAWRGLEWCILFFLPEIAGILKCSLFPKSSVQYFRRVYKQVLAQRGGYNDEAKENDLLDALRKIKYNADKNNEDMDEDVIIAQAAVFVQAGFDTSASNLTYLTCELAYRPDLQDIIFKELSEAKQALGDKDFDASVLSELKYFNAAIEETLRKYPPLGWLDRIADRDYKIDDKLTIPKGTTVYVNAMGMQHDPEYYPNPDEFIPERFLPENQDPNRPFMPFGEGPRICIGMRFAYRSIWYVLAEVLMNFKILPLPGTTKPDRFSADTKGLLLTPGLASYVQFVPRNKSF